LARLFWPAATYMKQCLGEYTLAPINGAMYPDFR
jgi:hypothetical protein